MTKVISIVNGDCWEAVYIDNKLAVSDPMHITPKALLRALIDNGVTWEDVFTHTVLAIKNPEEAPEDIDNV